MGRIDSRIAGRLLATLGSVLVVGGFFLDWFAGSSEFAGRTFSGADLARLLRNLDEVESSADESGQLRAWTLVLYLAPALAANALAMVWLPVSRRAAGIAAAAGGLYSIAVLATLLGLSVASSTDLERVVGEPMAGFWVSGIGAAMLIGMSATMLRDAVNRVETQPTVSWNPTDADESDCLGKT